MAAVPSLDEIKTAAQYAFKQGNYDDAKTLDDLYRSQYTAQQPVAQSQQPVDPMAAYKAKVAQDDAQTTDSALGYSVDQAQRLVGKGIEAGGRAFGSDSMSQYGSQVVEQQDKDIAAGGYQPNYTKSLRETYNEDGLGSAVGWTVEKTAENAASGGAALIGGAAAALTAPISMPLAAVIGGVTTVGSVAMGAGESAFEQEDKTGDYDAKLALGVGTLIGMLDKFGAGKVIPKDRLMKMTAEQISQELAQKGFGAAAASVLKKTGIEAATETAQEGLSVGSAAIRGGEYTPQELGDRALEAAVLGGTTSVAAQGGIGTLGAATNLVSGGGSKPVTQREEQARAAFAQRLDSKVQASKNADGPAYDLGDVDADSRSGAKAVIDSAHSDMSARLKTLVSLLKSRIAPDKADTFDTVIEKSDASLAAVKAKNKVKNVVDAEDFAAFEALVGDTAEGQEAINLMHEMNELTRVYSDGLTGGISRYTDNLNPFGGSANYSGQAAQKAIAPYASLAGFMASPALTAAQVSGFVGGRAIDKLTGRRSRVANYVANNQGNTGQRPPTGPSLRNQEIEDREREAAQVEQEQMQAVQQQQEAQAQQEAEVQQQAQNDADLDERIYNQGGMPAAGGPEGTLSSVLGLDTEQLMNLLDQVIETEPNPEMVDAAIAAQQSIVRGGKVPDLTRLIRILKPRVNPDPQFWIERERGAAQQGAQAKLSRQEENYQRGIENNRKAAAALSDELNADESITKVEKALLLKSLQDLQLDLGLNPVATLESMYKRLQEQKVSPEAIDKYLAPYMDRVTQQQESKQAVLTAQDEVESLSEPMDSRSLSAPVLEETTEQRKQRAEEQGYDTTKVYYHGTFASFVENTAYESFNNPNPMPGINRVGTWLDDSPENYAYLDGRANDVVYPVYIKNTKGFDIETTSVDTADPFMQLEQFIAADMDIELRFDGAIPPNSENNKKIDKWSKSLRDGGYTHINLLGSTIDGQLTDGKPRNFTIVLDPKNIRSVNAQFDPAKTDSGNLSDSRSLGAPVLTSVPKLDIISISNGTEVPPKLQGKTQVAGYLQERALEKLGGKVRQLDNEQDRDAIADDMVAEAIYEMESTGGNMEWYDSIMEQMVEMMSMKHPELKTDPDARTALFASIAITSQNLAVPDNLVYGEEVYAHYKKTGRFLEKKYGGKGASVKKNLVKANKLLDSLGSMQKLTLFLETKFTVGELEPILKKHLESDPKAKIISGENVDQEVYGSAVFGPKIGNGFYTNLRGDFTPVTIDMWFMRTVGRLSGKVLLFDEKTFKKQLSRLKTAVGRKKISREQLIAKATEIKKQHEKDYKLYKAEYQSGERTKSEAVLAAESVVKSLKDTRDAPSSGTERVQLRDTVTRAVAKFKEQTGIDIPPASFQALIWYPEQDLYKKLGVKLKHTRADYANSTKALLLKEGYDEQEINAASDRVRVSREQGSGSVRPGTGVVDQRSAGQPGGRSSGTVQQQATSGILNQVDSAQLDLPFGKPDVIPSMARPTPANTKDSMPKAQEAFEVAIGKPGSKFEKGVSTEADILQIAEILNIFPRIFDNRGDYLAASGKSINDTSIGNFADIGDSLGEARVLAAGVRSPSDGKPITNLEFLITLIHENIGHALESRSPGNGETQSYSMPNMHPKSSGRLGVNQRSLRAEIGQILTNALATPNDFNKKTLERAKKIRAEIEAIQDQTEVFFEGNPQLGTSFLRDSPIKWEKQFIDEMKGEGLSPESTANLMKMNRKIYQDYYSKDTDYTKYKRNNAEFSVDPVILYVMNPTLMKKVAPETAKLIQGHFNSSKIPVSFHANPIVTVLAIIMAGVAQMEDDEEEKKNPGALTPQPGALTA